MTHPPEPSSEECTAHARGEWEGRRTLALWYPQMGGYVSKAVAVDNRDDDGPDVYVWHDGAFPFTGDDRELWGMSGRSPARLHLCDPEQFVGFGRTLTGWLDDTEGDDSAQDSNPVRP